MSVEPVLCQCKLLHRWIALAFPLRVSGGAVSLAAMETENEKKKWQGQRDLFATLSHAQARACSHSLAPGSCRCLPDVGYRRVGGAQQQSASVLRGRALCC